MTTPAIDLLNKQHDATASAQKVVPVTSAGVVIDPREWRPVGTTGTVLYAKNSAASPGTLIDSFVSDLIDCRSYSEIHVFMEITASSGGTLADNGIVDMYDPSGTRDIGDLGINSANFTAVGSATCIMASNQIAGTPNGRNNYLARNPWFIKVRYSKGGTATVVTGYVYVVGF
jgi:hypothetical protein